MACACDNSIKQVMFDQQPKKSLLPSYYTTSKTKPKADKTMC
jgi:hypothetical protein